VKEPEDWLVQPKVRIPVTSDVSWNEDVLLPRDGYRLYDLSIREVSRHGWRKSKAET